MAISKFPSVRTSSKADPEVRALSDIASKMTGQTGNGLDRVITVRELAAINGFNLKNIGRNVSIDFNPDFTETDVTDTPVTPENVEFFPAYETVLMSWDMVDGFNSWFAYTEIFRADITSEQPSPLFSDAELVATTISYLYTDYVSSSRSYRYWIRHFGKNGVAGPLHDTNGTDVTTFEKPIDVLEEYSKDIYQGENYAWIRSEMGVLSGLSRAFEGAMPNSGLLALLRNADSLTDLLAEQQLADALDKHATSFSIKSQFSHNYARLSGGVSSAVTLAESYVNRIASLEAKFVPGGDVEQAIEARIDEYDLALAGEEGAIATSLRNFTVSYDGNDVSLDTLSSVVAANNGVYEAQWGVKTNVNDLQGGVGFFNDGIETSFVVDASVFAVTGGSETGVLPFVIKNNRVVMAEAFIDHAAIYTLIAQNITAERIAASIDITSPTINGGDINGVTLNVNDRTTISSQGYLTSIGAQFKSITIVDNNDNPILDSSGIKTQYIQGLDSEISEQISTVIDAAFINTLFGNNGTFSGTVYAENIEGDVFDAKDYHYSGTVNVPTDLSFDLFSGQVSSGTFDRVLMFGSISLQSVIEAVTDEGATLSVYLEYYINNALVAKSSTMVFSNNKSNVAYTDSHTFPPVVKPLSQSGQNTPFKVVVKIDKSSNHYYVPTLKHTQPTVVSLFKAGGSLS